MTAAIKFCRNCKRADDFVHRTYLAFAKAASETFGRHVRVISGNLWDDHKFCNFLKEPLEFTLKAGAEVHTFILMQDVPEPEEIERYSETKSARFHIITTQGMHSMTIPLEINSTEFVRLGCNTDVLGMFGRFSGEGLTNKPKFVSSTRIWSPEQYVDDVARRIFPHKEPCPGRPRPLSSVVKQIASPFDIDALANNCCTKAQKLSAMPPATPGCEEKATVSGGDNVHPSDGDTISSQSSNPASAACAGVRKTVGDSGHRIRAGRIEKRSTDKGATKALRSAACC